MLLKALEGLQEHDLLIYHVLTPIAAVSCLFCGISIIRHLRAPGRGDAHALTIRILLMVPVYSVVSLLALVYRPVDFAKVIVAFQKLFECIVLFAFLQLLVLYLGGLPGIWQHLKPEACHHIFPVSWVLPKVGVSNDSWAPPPRFVRRSLGIVIMYVPIMLACFVATALSYLLPLTVFNLVTSVVGGFNFVATGVAMYGLILFYHANMESLAPMRPIAKLVSIKLLVIVSAWQEIGLKLAVHFHWLQSSAEHSASHYSEEQLAESIIAGCLIVEMFLLSIFHCFVYPSREALYDEPVREEDAEAASAEKFPDKRDGVLWRIRQVLDLSDIPAFYKDLCHHAPSETLDKILDVSDSWGCICCRYGNGSDRHH